MGGGGGSTHVDMRNPKKEQPVIGNWYDWQQGQLNDYISGNPLVSAANKGSLNFWNQLPGMLSQFTGFGNQLTGYGNELTNDQNQIRGYQGRLGANYNQLGTIGRTLGGLISAPFGPAAITRTGGALTPQMARDVSQQTRNISVAQGSAQSPGALGTELLNRDAYRQQRYNTALQQEQGLLGQQQGVYGQQAAVTGQGAGLSGLLANLTGQKAGLVGQRAGLLGQQQGLQTGGLNQLLGTQGANVSGFTGLQNPILAYLGNLFGGNQQASIAQAQVNAQQNQANSSKMGGIAGGAGSIIGAVLPALMAFSDKRMKQKIRGTGLKTEEGVPIKTFEYKAQPGQRILGVMAQDVEKVRPDAVLTDFRSGLKFIDRTKIDIPMGKVA